jgi:hypothetical protein
MYRGKIFANNKTALNQASTFISRYHTLPNICINLFAEMHVFTNTVSRRKGKRDRSKYKPLGRQKSDLLKDSVAF